MRSIKEILRIRQYLRSELALARGRGNGRSAGNSISTGFMASLPFFEDSCNDLVQRRILHADVKQRVFVEDRTQGRRHSRPLDLERRQRPVYLDHLTVSFQARR